MHLQLKIKVSRNEGVAEIFDTVDHYIGGDWKAEHPKGCLREEEDDDYSPFGRSQVLDDFIPARCAFAYLNMVRNALPTYAADVWSTHFPLRQELADSSHLSKLRHVYYPSNRMAKNWVSCLRGAGLSEHQIGQWNTLLMETSMRFDPADPKSSLKRCIQSAARFLMSKNGERASRVAWNTYGWEVTAISGIKDYVCIRNPRSAQELVDRLQIFKEAKIEEPPYHNSFFDLAMAEIINGVINISMVGAAITTLLQTTQNALE